MQPNQPGQPDYSFITDPSGPKKSKLSGSKSKRILVVAAGGGILLVVFFTIFSLLFKGGTSNTERLVSIVAQQTELIRVSALGEKSATSVETKNFATTVNLSLVTAENQLSTAVTKQGRKLKPAEINSAKNEKTDATLTTAEQINKFDETFNQTIKTSLDAYQKSLSDAYEASSSASEKAMLQDLYKKAKILASTVPAS
jgi:hypothetical protein